MKKTIKNAMSSLTAKLAALLLTFTCAGTAWGALSGTGTSADDPFLIGTLADLQEFRDAVNAGNAYAGKYVKLTADIDLDNAKWTPIANNGDSTKFGGTFDGDSHTISNFYIDETTPAYHATGFFGAINGTIKNLKFVNAKVAGISSGPATVNGIAVVVGAMPYGGMIDNVSVQNATVDGNRYVGAIVGYVQGTVKNCTVRDVTVTATPDKLSGSYDNGDKAGLIAGYSNPPSTITGNKLYGTLNVTAFGDVAGILGYGHSSDIVTGNEICDEANLTVTVDRVTGWYDRNRTSSTRVGGGLANSADIAENNGISTTAAAIVNPITSAVAQIGTVQYGTLEAATRAYQSGDTIELVGDASSMTAPEGWVINAGTPPTLTVDPFTTYTKVVDGFYQNAATYKDSTDFYITNLNGLKFFRDFVNGDATVVEDYVSRGFSGYTSGLQLFQNNIFQGKTVHLLSDIDLAGEQWVAIGYQDVDSKGLKNLYFYGTFDAGIYDGNGTLTGRHKISNLDVAESYAADGPSLKRTYTGLFGLLAGGTATGVKNLTIENATVAGRQYVGAVVGRIYNGGAVVENCQVIGTININGSSAWVGGLVGECRGSIKDSSVSATGTISGLYDVGGLAGGLYQYNTGAGKEVEISNSAVSNVTVSAGYAYGLGGLVGVAGLAGDGYTSNVTISENNANNVTVTTDDTNYAGDGLMGVLVGYANENKAYAVLEDNTITGTTSANENGTAITTQIGADNENTSIVGKEITFDESGKVTAGIFENIPESAIASGYLATDNPDTTTSADYPLTIGGPYVAQIGNNYYPTLAAAFAAAQDGDTIKLIADLTQDNGVVFDKANANVTLDLNGKTFTVNKGANCKNRAIRIDNGTLTVTNGSIVAVGSGTTSSDGAGCYGAFRVESAGTLYAENVNLSNARPWGLNVKVIGGKAYLTNVTINSSYGGGIEVTEASLGDHSQAGYAELTGCTFTQTGYFDHCSTALSVSGGSELVVNSGTYTSENYGLYVFSSGGNITVKGGTFTGNKAAVKAAIDTNTYPNYTGAVQISGGTFTGALDVTSPASMAVSGGNFDRQVPANYCAKDYVPTTEPVLIDNVPYYTVTTMGVAKIERTGEATQYFSTLEAAIEAASAGDTVTLIADISDLSTVTVNAGQNVTLDLNGHTIEAGLEQAGRHYYAIDNYGTFTLKDSSESQTGKIRARGIENLGNGVMIVDGGIIEAIDTNGGAAIWNEGTLTMNGGVLRATHVGSSSDTYGPGALNNRGTATITKADIQSANKRTYAIVSSGAITINPAKDDDVIVAGAHGGLAVDSGTATVTGGRFSSTEYYGLYVSNDGTGTAAKAQVTVSGGEFTGNTQSVHIGSDVNTPVDSVIAISGGTFHGTIFAENKVTEDGGISVSGGSFENPVPEAYCADGYIPNAEQDSETGMYTVKTGSYVAQIGETKYETLADAFAAANAAGTETTIKMIDNSAEAACSTVAAGKAIILDLNGKTVSYTTDEKNVYFLTNKGTLTVKDTSENAEGQILLTAQPDSGYSMEAVTVFNLGGTLTLESGTVKNATGGGLAYAIKNAVNWGHVSTFNMTGGIVSAPGGDAALRVYNNTSFSVTADCKNYVNISGGTILDTGIFIDTFLAGTYSASFTGDNLANEVNISGGTINGLIDMKIRHPFNTALNITGGDFTNTKLWVRKHSEYNASLAEPTDPMVYISGGKFAFVAGKAFGLAYDCGATSWTTYEKPYAVSGGVFNVEVPETACAENYISVSNEDAETKAAYPYTVAETLPGGFVYPIEGTAGLPIPSDWLAANSVAGYSDAEQPILATMTNAMVMALSGKADNGMPMWQSYVLGLTPNGANATALRLAATAKDATMVTITAAVNVPATLENSGTTVSFRLVEQNADGTWTDIEAGKASPSFDVSLDTVAGKVLTIFADIVTE